MWMPTAAPMTAAPTPPAMVEYNMMELSMAALFERGGKESKHTLSEHDPWAHCSESESSQNRVSVAESHFELPAACGEGEPAAGGGIGGAPSSSGGGGCSANVVVG